MAQKEEKGKRLLKRRRAGYFFFLYGGKKGEHMWGGKRSLIKSTHEGGLPKG